jgi:hypothetical protein
LQEAARHHLAPIVFVGDDVQHHCTLYYNGDYSLRLAELCERVGHPLESNSAVDRARGQLHILQAMAQGMTDVRTPKKPEPEPAALSDESSFVNDGLSDESLDEHPFWRAI